MKEWKVNVNKKELLRHMGSISQVGGLKRYELTEGRAKGVEAVDVITGSGLEFTVLSGRCMDLNWTRYKGVPISWQSKAELTSGAYLEQNGMEWLRSFYGGMLTTCGFSNAGGPCQEERRIFGLQNYGLHGRLAHIPATQVCCKECWKGEKYVMTVEGQMRQSAVHGENMVLHRTITAKLGEKRLWLHDEIENEGHTAEALLLLYHMNFGYPLLSKKSRLAVNSESIWGADSTAEQEMELCKRFHEPVHLQDERCYFHELRTDAEGNTRLALINEELELGVSLRFNRKQLPCLTEWKMLAESEYVLGLEPGNVNPIGRTQAKEQNKLQFLEPGEAHMVDIELEVLDGPEELAGAEKEIEGLGNR